MRVLASLTARPKARKKDEEEATKEAQGRNLTQALQDPRHSPTESPRESQPSMNKIRRVTSELLERVERPTRIELA